MATLTPNTPMSPIYQYQPETREAHLAIPENVTSRRSNQAGMNRGEPIIVILDSLLRYAKAFKAGCEKPLAEEPMLREHFIQTLTGIRSFLNWDGAVAMEQGLTCDSKDNGACESLFWHAVHAAGLEEKDLDL